MTTIAEAAAGAAISVADKDRRDRIITHMNRDHARELSHFLRHYADVPEDLARSSPSVEDVTLRGMLIRAGGFDYAVSFSPPLAEWSEIRPRFVEMDAVARSAMGISDIYIASYAPPEGFDCVVFAAVAFYFCCVASLPWVVPDTRLWGILSTVFPGGPDWFRWIVETIFFPVLGIHVAEVLILDRTRMQRHGVPRWSNVWWLWMSSCFFEGLPAFRRIDRIVAQKREQKDAKKH